MSSFSNNAENFQARNEKMKNLPKPEKLEIGKKYFCSFVNQTVTLTDIKNNEDAIVSRGALKIKCPIASLRVSPLKQNQERVIVKAQSRSDVMLEYDCRGMRLAQLQNLIDRVAPELLSGNIPFINIIHGHGDGILKKWLRSFIKKDKSIEWDQTQTGNDGETRMILAE
jgi:DNA mismatch repair protein MutS2